MKVLYVEDNPVDIDLTRRQLQKKAPHIQINCVRTQSAALSILKSPDISEYDAVLTDMHLQDGDGIAVLSHIRAHSLPLAVILLTGQGDEEAAVSAMRAGANDYIIKKTGYLDQLPDLLEEALRAYRETSHSKIYHLKVLYFEHSATDIDLTRRHLDKYAPHIHLDIVESAKEFHALLTQPGNTLAYDVILLDYRLPQNSALEVLAKMNSMNGAKPPVVLVSGKGDEKIAVKCMKLGAFDYIVKNKGYLYKLPSVVENAYSSSKLALEHKELLESEMRYRSLFEKNHVVMLLIDPKSGSILDANTAATDFYGWSEDVITSKTIFDFVVADREQVENELNDAIHEKQHQFFMQHRLASGEVRDVEVYRSPMVVGGSLILYSMIYDISQKIIAQKEKEELQKQLVQAQKLEAIGHLAGGIAHDFNNILTVILGFSSLARINVKKGSEIDEDLEEVYKAGLRAKELVQQILTFARKAEDEINAIEIQPIVKEIIKFLRSSIPSTVEIRSQLTSRSLILGNATQVHQVLMNLCTNAAHAMRKHGGILKISLLNQSIYENSSYDGLSIKPGDYIELKVSDTGEGIPQETIKSIFEPYFTTKIQGEGTGLGLAVVNGIVESYGGRIFVESELGKGTTFTVLFPITHEDIKNLSDEQSLSLSGSERILFIDDEVPITKVGQKMLEHLGYNVTVSNSSPEALEKFRAAPDTFDLVISDMTMPGIRGDVLVREIQKIRKEIPVIICTGYSQELTEENMASLNLQAVLYKPMTKLEIASTIRRIFDERKCAQP
jgi:PAS domain S-box-containing protein